MIYIWKHTVVYMYGSDIIFNDKRFYIGECLFYTFEPIYKTMCKVITYTDILP